MCTPFPTPRLDQIGAALVALLPEGAHSISAHYYPKGAFFAVNLHDNRVQYGCVSGDGPTLQEAFDKARLRLLLEIDAGTREKADLVPA